MPPAPAPAEELASILGLGSLQRVDLAALILDMRALRRGTTAYGMKGITDITIVDGSMTPGEEQQVSAKMSMFVGASAEGAALLKSMQEAHEAKAPVAMYGLTCHPRAKENASSNQAKRSFGRWRLALTPSWSVCNPRPTT